MTSQERVLPDKDFHYSQTQLKVAVSPNGIYQVLAGKTYHNMLLYNTYTEQAYILRSKAPYSQKNRVRFVDDSLFYVESGRLLNFYETGQGKPVQLLQMTFGEQMEDKILLGFTHDVRSDCFAAFYTERDRVDGYKDNYHAALFDRSGALLDSFATEIHIPERWGKLVHPKLVLVKDEVFATSKHLTADYVAAFYVHTTLLVEKKAV